MAQETTFPTGPFYIQSKIALSNWALTTNELKLKLSPLKGGIEHLWQATPDSRGGSFLKNIHSGKFLTVTGIMSGLGVTSRFDPSDVMQLFRAEDLGGNWRAINLLCNWELKMNVYNSDRHGRIGPFEWNGGADNESWRLIPETSTVETVSVEFDLKGATTNLNLPPMVSSHSDLDNRAADAPMTGQISLALSETTSRSITNSTSDTTGRIYTQTFGAKGGIDKVFEVSASASFNESTSKTIAYTDATVDAKTVTHSQLVNTNVPVGKKYRYSLMVFNGKCSIPYTAHMLFKSAVPGAVPHPFVSTGIYTGVNAIYSGVKVSDITQGPAAAVLVEEYPVSIIPGE